MTARPASSRSESLQNNNAKVVDALAAGETSIVARNGEAVAELWPLRRARRTAVPRDEVMELSRTGIRIDPEPFRADLDSAIDQDVQR